MGIVVQDVSLDANAIVTLVQAKALLEILDTKYDAILATLINGVSTLFDITTRRNLMTKTYTAVYFDGNGMPDLFLPNYPVTVITSITEDDIALVEGVDEDYILYAEEGRLLRDGVWLEGAKKIKMTYTAGYVIVGTITLPADLKLKCLKRVAIEWKKYRDRSWGESSKTYPDGSITFEADDDLLKDLYGYIRW